MRIYDQEGKRVLSAVTLYLTPAEAAQLAATAKHLAANPAEHHAHVSDDSFSSEVTLAVYTDENLTQFDSESLAVITGERS